MSNFEVVNSSGYVDILPHPNVALSAEVLSKIVERRIKTELGFTEGISIGDGSEFPNPTYQFGIRLNGGSAAMAERLREMDLFPSLRAEKLDGVEFRFVYEGRGYVDPRLTLRVGQFVKYAHALRAQFGQHSGFKLERGQFRYGAIDPCNNLNDRMTDFCRPLYRVTSKITGQNNEGNTWMRVSGPLEQLSLSKLTQIGNVLQNPQPIIRECSYAPSNAVIPLNAGTIETPEDVKYFYEAAATVSLRLGIHPVGDFKFTHNDHTWTTLRPSPRSSR